MSESRTENHDLTGSAREIWVVSESCSNVDGILVRSGPDLNSDVLGRLAPGARVQADPPTAGRVHYTLISGAPESPKIGWVSLRANGKDLILKEVVTEDAKAKESLPSKNALALANSVGAEVVTAVFCQTAVESAQNDHASMVHSVLKNKQAHLDKLRQLFNELGDDTTGVITFKMLESKMNSPEVRAYFEVLGLDVWDAWSFFKLLDLDQRGDVEIEAFLMGCLRLRGQARSIDLCKLIHDQAWLLKQQSQFHVNCEKEFKKLRSEIRTMAGHASASANILRHSEEVNGTYMQ